MLLLPVRSAELSPFQKEAFDLIHTSHSLEEVVLDVVDRQWKLQMSSVAPPAEERAFYLELRCRADEVARCFIPSPVLEARHRIRPISLTTVEYSDMEGFAPDPEWYEERDCRLRLSVDDTEGVTLAPPASLAELMLSYAAVDYGICNITSQILRLRRQCMTDAAQLELAYYNPHTDRGWEEHVHVRLEKLRQLVSKRRTRRESGHAG